MGRDKTDIELRNAFYHFNTGQRMMMVKTKLTTHIKLTTIVSSKSDCTMLMCDGVCVCCLDWVG